jgi:hypothetical protein
VLDIELAFMRGVAAGQDALNAHAMSLVDDLKDLL